VGLNPAKSDGFSWAIKICSTTSFTGEAKLLAPCHKILQHVEEPWIYEQRYRQNSQTLLAMILLAFLLGVFYNQSSELWWMNQE
jgi:hypothetical protein